MAFSEKDKVWWEAAPAAQFHSGSSSDQNDSGACRGERLVLGEDVPDRFGELSGDVDPGHLGAALSAQALPGPLIPLPMIGDIGRFSSPKKLTGYTGLCPLVRQSGNRDVRGPLAKNGPKSLAQAPPDRNLATLLAASEVKYTTVPKALHHLFALVGREARRSIA
jgi:hypothetical protein